MSPLEENESKFQARVVALARACGWRVFHPRNMKKSTPGYPDLTMTRRGRLVIAEIKTSAGKPSGEQTDWLSDLSRVAQEAGNVRVCLWRPADWPEIEDVLR